MRRVGALALALSKDWLRNRRAVFFALLFPIILLVIFSTVFAGGTAEFTVYVQNNDVVDGEPTNLSETFVEALNDTEPLTVRSLAADRNVSAWSRQSDTEGATRVIVVPEGFAEQVRAASMQARIAVVSDTVSRFQGQMNASQRTRIQRGLAAAQGNATNVSAARVRFLFASGDESAPAVRGIVESVVARFNSRAVGVETPPVEVAAGSLRTSSLEAVDYYLPAFIAVVTLINGLITVTTVVAGFNSDGTLKRLVATPLRRRDWILANVVQQALLAVALTWVMVLVARLLFGVTVLPGPLAHALVVLGAVGFSGLGMAFGSFLEDADAATSLGNAIALPMMFLSGVFWQLELMPGYLQTLATLLPLYHLHRGLLRVMVLGTTDGVAVPFAVLGGTAVVAVALAVWATRWRNVGD